MSESERLTASFRDRSGFVFRRDGVIYRQVNQAYREDYEVLLRSGLYDELKGAELLVTHQEVDAAPHEPVWAYKVLRPRPIPFISYPYEWCFSQLKAAALLTLEIQRRALARGLSLKDASAFNIQFRGWRPELIDTLSFEIHRPDEPWVAYRQFCQHFYAPLALMSQTDVGLTQLFVTNLDGVPLDLAARLLPARTRLRFGPLVHIHLHARSQRAFAARIERPKARRFSSSAMLGLIDSLESGIQRLSWAPRGTEWVDYEGEHTYTSAALAHKRALVAGYLDRIGPRTVWDLGANTGELSRVARSRGIATVAFDIDPACVERNYLDAARRRDAELLPLRLDLTSPSPALGWQNRERMSLFERGPVEAAMALALVHHLAISANLPLDEIAAFCRRICTWLIIELVPKEDPQARRLIFGRPDIFPDYTREHFEKCFETEFSIEAVEPIHQSGRILYLMRRKGGSP